MKAAESVDAWVDKAEGDYHMALAAMRQRKHPLYDPACFHCQQCAEKYLKGFLVRHKVAFRKTHDLRELNSLCLEIDDAFKLIASDLVLLKNYGSIPLSGGYRRRRGSPRSSRRDETSTQIRAYAVRSKVREKQEQAWS